MVDIQKREMAKYDTLQEAVDLLEGEREKAKAFIYSKSGITNGYEEAVERNILSTLHHAKKDLRYLNAFARAERGFRQANRAYERAKKESETPSQDKINPETSLFIPGSRIRDLRGQLKDVETVNVLERAWDNHRRGATKEGMFEMEDMKNVYTLSELVYQARNRTRINLKESKNHFKAYDEGVSREDVSAEESLMNLLTQGEKDFELLSLVDRGYTESEASTK